MQGYDAILEAIIIKFIAHNYGHTRNDVDIYKLLVKVMI